MSLIKRITALDRFFKRGMILDSPEIRAEKLPDGRVMLHPRTPGTAARIRPSTPITDHLITEEGVTIISEGGDTIVPE